MFPKTYIRISLLTGATMLPLGACGQSASDQSPQPGKPPVALERFYNQKMAWKKCDTYANTAIEAFVYKANKTQECGRFEVPLDYAKPEGKTAQIAVLRLPARGQAIGSLVMNPGGPGGSGLFGAAATGMALSKSPITEKFDFVGFDPRGVGASIPAIDCYTDKEADRYDVPLTTQGTTVQWTKEDTKKIVDRCAKDSGGADKLAHVGTRDVARDMDVLRAVLGDEKLTFFGQSYGTRLGAVYAEQFPQNVRAMLLDGGIDPLQGTFERRVKAYAGFQRAFEQMAASCAKQADCPIGSDPAKATASFQAILRPLYKTPVPALDTELDFDAAFEGVIAGLYTPTAWPRIITGLNQVNKGRGDELLQLGYDFALRDAKGAWSNTAEALFAINCMDEERLTEQQGGELRSAIFKAAPFMDPGVKLAGARDACEHWPVKPTLGFPYAQNIKGLPKTLVVSITGDPTTPHAGGISLAKTLGSTLLTVEGEGHTIVSIGTNPCVNAIAAAYLIDLKLPAKDQRCKL